MTRPLSAPLAALSLTFCALLPGCAEPPKDRSPDQIRAGLAWIRPGTTTRKDVLLNLGLPSASFEDQRVLAYRVATMPDGSVRPATVLNVGDDPRLQPWGQFTSLVLVFDDSGLLREHRVVIAEK